MRKFSLPVISLSVVCLALIFSGCTRKTPPAGSDASGAGRDDSVIRIGEVGSLTGSEATFGTSTHNGIMLAVKSINAAGGVNGKKFEVITLDDQGKPEEAATAVTKHITQNKVHVIVGEVASSRSLAMAPIAQGYSIPMVSPSSTNPKVTEQGDYIFRICFIDPFQGLVMAKYAHNILKAKKVAILRDMKNDYSIGLSDIFTEKFKQMGGEIVLDQSYSSGDIDFKSQLTAIRGTAPDAIYLPGYYTEVGLIARQARELGIKVPFMGGDGWDSPKLREIGGAALNGSFFSNHSSAEDKSPNYVEFVTKYKAEYNAEPDSLGALGYDSVLVLADAVRRAKSVQGPDLRDALRDTKDVLVSTGKITIDAQRNARKPAVIMRVDPTGFRYETSIQPE